MALPQFRQDGTLPVGEHLATWPEFANRFGGNNHRTVLLGGLRSALAELERVGCKTAWIDGSFVTSKPEPNDFDMCWHETGVDVAALDPVFRSFANTRAAQKARRVSRRPRNDVSPLVSAEVRCRQGHRSNRLVRARNDYH